jgi:hypothetical protein
MSKKIEIQFDFDAKNASNVVNSFKDINKSIGEATESIKKFDLSGFLKNAQGAASELKALGSSLRSVAIAANPVTLAVGAAAAAVAGYAIAQYKATAANYEMYKSLQKLQKELGTTEEMAFRLVKAFSAYEEKVGSLNRIAMAFVNNTRQYNKELEEYIKNVGLALSENDLKKVADFIEESASLMESWGFTNKEMLNLSITMQQAGQNISKFQNAMTQTMERLRAPTKEIQTLLDSLGLGDLPKKLSSGAITAKDAFLKLGKVLVELNKRGVDVTGMLSKLSDSLGEMGAASLKYAVEGVNSTIQLTDAQKRLKEAYDEVSKSIAYRTAMGKEAVAAMQEEIIATSKLEAAWNNLVAAWQNSAFFNWIKKSIASMKSFGAAILNDLETSIYALENKASGARLRQLQQEALAAAAKEIGVKRLTQLEFIKYKDIISKYVNEAQRKFLEEERNKRMAKQIKEEPDKAESIAGGAAVPGSGGVAATPREASALRRAEELLELHYKKKRAIIEAGDALGRLAKEEAALLLANLEQKRYEEVVALAKKLQGTLETIDGETVVYKKLTSEELRQIEVTTFENLQKIKLSEVEFMKFYNRHLLEMAKLSEEERMQQVEAYLRRQQAYVEGSYSLGLTSFYEYNQRLLVLEEASIKARIAQERAAMERRLQLETLTKEERLVIIKETNNKIQELEQQSVDLRIQLQQKLAERQKELAEETKRLANENFDALFNRNTGNSFIDGFLELARKVNATTREVTALNEEIAKLAKERDDAIKNNDFKHAGAVAELITQKEIALKLAEQEVTLNKVSYGLGILKQGLSALTSQIVTSLSKEIEALNIQIEKRKELLSLAREQFSVEEARLKTILQLEGYREEQRVKELEALRKDIPEAQQELLNQEILNEKERSQARREAIASNLEQERRRIRDIERSVKNLENAKLEMQERQFETERMGKIATAVMDGALGIISLWARPGFPLAVPLSIALGGITAANIAAIASQKNPYTQRFAKGTLNVTGGREGEDSVPALLMPGEAVIPRETNMLYRNAITAIYNKSIPPSVFDSAINMYKSGEAIVEAINKKPVSIVNIDENGFTEYIVKKVEDYYIIKNKLGL